MLAKVFNFGYANEVKLSVLHLNIANLKTYLQLSTFPLNPTFIKLMQLVCKNLLVYFLNTAPQKIIQMFNCKTQSFSEAFCKIIYG